MGAVVGALLLLIAPTARAFSIDTVATRGCHEEMTAAALRVVRAELPSAAPLAPDRNEQALIRDLAFEAPVDLMDLGGTSLLIGVRDPDLEGNDGNDLSRLALVHGDPQAQRNHCLHGDSPEPGGSPEALRECRALILERLEQALDGLDDMGRPDPARRTSLAVYLGVRHRVDASLPTFYVRIGQAIHTIQDSFAHTYRTPDDEHITAVVNWLDQVGGNFNEVTDGPPHSTELDRCDDPDDMRRARTGAGDRVRDGGAAHLARSRAGPRRQDRRRIRSARPVAQLRARLQRRRPLVRCARTRLQQQRTAGRLPRRRARSRGGRGAGAALALVGLALVRARRRRRTGVLLVLLGIVASTGSARAETAVTAQSAAATAAANVPPPRVTPVPEPGPENRKQPALGAYIGAGGSLSDPALAATLGVRFRARAHLTLGLDIEWNPWFALNGEERFRTGALNVFGTVIVRIPLAYQEFNLRVTTSAGAVANLDRSLRRSAGEHRPLRRDLPAWHRMEGLALLLCRHQPARLRRVDPAATRHPVLVPAVPSVDRPRVLCGLRGCIE